MATLKPRTGTRLSIEEFLELELPDTFIMPRPRTSGRMELDEGELYIMPRPRTGRNTLPVPAIPVDTDTTT